jgi:hypothetical protein
MPPEPIEFRIIQNLQAALQGISVAGGYHYTVQGSAVKLDPNHKVEDLIAPDGPRPFVLIELTPESWHYDPCSQVVLTLEPVVHWVSDATPTDDASRLQTFFRGCADVEQAIAPDTVRGGLATDIQVVGRTFDTAVDGAQVWAQINVRIRVHRTYGQPNG